MIGCDAEELHRLLRLADARAADGEIARGHRRERLVHQAGGEAVAVARGEEDDVDLRAVGRGIDGVAAGADRLIVDVWGDDEDPVLPCRRLKMRVLHFDVILRRLQQ